MNDHQKLVVDFINQEDSLKILPTPPILSSQQAGWSSVGLFYYRHPAHSTTEHYLTHHVLAIAYNQFQLEVIKDGKTSNQLVENGVIQLTPAQISQWLRWDREGEFLIITLCPQFMEKVVYESIKGNAIELIPQFSIIDPVIQHIAAALKAEIETECCPNGLFGESAATMLAVRLIQAYATSQPAIKTYSDGLAKNKLQIAIDYINSHLDQDIKLTNIAELVGVSHYYFCHLFKQSIGITPHQYLMQQRIEKAKILLKNRELSIAEVALECGFTDQSHLTKHCKRVVGLTPKAMRTQ